MKRLFAHFLMHPPSSQFYFSQKQQNKNRKQLPDSIAALTKPIISFHTAFRIISAEQEQIRSNNIQVTDGDFKML